MSQVVFEATVGSAKSGFIALDDIDVVDGACPREGFCNFEIDKCTWSNYRGKEDDFDWLRTAGGHQKVLRAPIVDKSLGTSRGQSEYSHRIKLTF